MADIDETTTVNIDLSDETLRIEHIKINGSTYKVGLSLDEQKSFNQALIDLNENIVLVNDDVETLNTNVTTLNSKVATLENEIAALKQLLENVYMAYYEVDEANKVENDNVYTDENQIADESTS